MKEHKKHVITDDDFKLQELEKYASLMTLGNGYLGVRGTLEENYTEQTRGMYVAGIYNKATENEVTELINLPDITEMKIEIDEEVFSLLKGKIISYKRTLQMDRGEIVREILWERKDGSKFQFTFQRFVAKNELHMLATKVTVISLDCDAKIIITTGIDAQQTNSGRQHLIEEKVSIHDEKIMLGVYRTNQTNQTVAIATACTTNLNCDINYGAKNRKIAASIKSNIRSGRPFVVEKIGAVCTSFDRGQSKRTPTERSLDTVMEAITSSYDVLLQNSELEWKKLWDNKRVIIHSTNSFDQTAIDFAIYHLEIMAPKHDERLSIAAKGLTGEGYKGHVFWDTEIFMLPFHLYTEPESAKNLLRYRYLNLQGAKAKAEKEGYQGALFPWESALTGEEETPVYAAINIKTGERQKVAAALAEHHIVADIAYAVINYYYVTKDDFFMRREGLTLLKETALFWMSRTEESEGQLHIKDVIGPDEYTEHIDNNAFTNYMALFNVEQALLFMKKNEDIDEDFFEKGNDFINRLYLPKENINKIIPQDDTFLSKKEIDLDKYKKIQGSQEILLDYSRQEVNEMQILKQADVVMLLYLFPELVPIDVVRKNLTYYEERTIHDSSLSKAIHAIVAMRSNDMKLAYRFFQEASLIDLGSNRRSSDEGIHAASLGALWLAVFEFMNITIDNNNLKVNPNLPEEWTELVFPLQYLGRRLEITATHGFTKIVKLSGPSISIEINGELHTLENYIEVFNRCNHHKKGNQQIE